MWFFFNFRFVGAKNIISKGDSISLKHLSNKKPFRHVTLDQLSEDNPFRRLKPFEFVQWTELEGCGRHSQEVLRVGGATLHPGSGEVPLLHHHHRRGVEGPAVRSSPVETVLRVQRRFLHSSSSGLRRRFGSHCRMCALPGREYRLFRKQYSGKTYTIDFHPKF